jgi:adenylate kinase
MGSFSRPVFRMVVLYVDEEVSVQRQLLRGRMVRMHNLNVNRSGRGIILEERATDNDEKVIVTIVIDS